MSEAVEVAIELALLRLVSSFAIAQGLTVAMPNKEFSVPPVSQTARWLRATFLPNETLSMALAHNDKDMHYGLLQIDVMVGKNSGEPRAARVAAQIIAAFKRGTVATSDGFVVSVLRTPTRGPLIVPNDEPWASLSVRIPFTCFASPPA